MKTANILYTNLIISLLFLASCKKVELPVVTNETPVFSLNGEFSNGTNLNLAAGDNDYFLFTNYTKDNDDLHTFIGELKPINCTSNCPNSIKISISDIQENTSGNIVIGNSLNPNLNFLLEQDSIINSHTESQMTLTGEAKNKDGININPNFNWVVNDTISLSGLTITLNLDEITPMNVCLEIQDNSFCESRTCSTIYLNSNQLERCLADFTVIDSTNTPITPLLLTVSDEILNGNNTFQWSNGDTTPSINATYGEHTLFVSSSDNCQGEMHKNIFFIQGESQYCSPDFSYFMESDTIIDSITVAPSFSQVIVEYTDENGVLFSSETAFQTTTSTFEISNTEIYERNDNNQATAKIDINFSINLVNSSGEELRLDNTNGTFGIAYPD